MSRDELRYHGAHADMHGAFGADRFGVLAERLAQFFGTPKYVLSQTVIVLLWILYNAYVAIRCLSTNAFDLYPFILLNLAFPTHAAYAAPLIFLAQTQAGRPRQG